MLSTMDVLNRFLKSKDLYKLTLGDSGLYDDYFYKKSQLKNFRILQTMGLYGVEDLKSLMIADRTRIEMYPTKALAGSYNENVQTFGGVQNGGIMLGGQK